ncbi:MAG: translesion error-prone DNA polymerase V autoproteolytic subunit [Alistipes sp.]|nr:translesion error-prone DNA polymerase V autoproteolytic subunit [Alistipes sp.]
MEKSGSLEIFRAKVEREVSLPFADHGIQAGFPSPAQDYIDEALDINKIVVRNPLTTFYARVRGDSLIDDDIKDGDLLVIDKSLEPRSGDLVVAAVEGEFTLKYLEVNPQGVWLMPANENYDPIPLDPEDPFQIFGVVTWYLKKPGHAR